MTENSGNNEVKTTPVVSVICITYNHHNFIKKTLDGFLIQKTNFPFEVIIHDDASQDGTQEIIKEYETLYPNIIKPIYQIENQFSKKVNIGKEFILSKIKGTYIALCEGDDYWIDPLKLQKQVDFLDQNEEYGLVYTEIDRIDENENIIDRSFFKHDSSPTCETFEDYLMHAPFRAPCTWLFRKSVYKERPKRYTVSDFPMLLDIVAHSKIYMLEDTTAKYRVLKESASHFTNLNRLYSFMKGVYQVQMDYAEKYKVSEEVIKTIKIKYAFDSYNFAVAQQDISQIKAADKLLIDYPELSYKFKIIKLLSKIRIGRFLVKARLVKLLKYKQ